MLDERKGMHSRLSKMLLGLVVAIGCTTLLGLSPPRALAEGDKVECPNPLPKTPDLARSDTYKDVPFKAGEIATYEVFYESILVGTGSLEVKPAQKLKGAWHRIFHAHAKTGDWYKLIFVAEDKVQATSRPWDFGISKFYMEQNEGKMFGNRLVQKKWLDFDHDNCKVSEKVWKPDTKDEIDTHDLHYGAVDALGAVYKLRTYDYEIGKTERFMVYTDGKNWWFDAEPIAKEKVTVKGGTFDTMKLKLHTYLGKELQQKGDVYVWIDQKTPSRPMVQIKGDIKIGSVWMELQSYTPGATSENESPRKPVRVGVTTKPSATQQKAQKR